jgi:MFS family permease
MASQISNQTDRPGMILAAIAVSVIGALFYNVLPLFVGVAQDYRGLDDAGSGLLASAFFVGFTLVNASGFFWIQRWNWRYVAIAALIVGSIALLAIGIVPGFAGLLVMTVLAGTSLSALYGIGTAALADTRTPARWYGAKIAAEAGSGALLLLLVLPPLVERWQFQGLLIGIAGTALLLAPLALGLPTSARERSETVTQGATRDAPAALFPIWSALITVLLFMAGATMLWAFMERFGAEAGYAAARLAQLLALTLVFAVIGSLLASAIGNRLGLRLPLLLSCTALVISAVLIGSSGSFLAYAAGACLMTIAFGFGLPFSVTIAAALDPDGRFVVLSASAIGIGVALAPALGGVLAGTYGYTGVLIAGAVIVLLALAAGLLALNSAHPQQLEQGRSDEDLSPLV